MSRGVSIRSVHPSLRARGHRPRPMGMERLAISHEQAAALDQISMSIFADCVNVGVSFQAAISAVYLSGLEHGRAIITERDGNHERTPQ